MILFRKPYYPKKSTIGLRRKMKKTVLSRLKGVISDKDYQEITSRKAEDFGWHRPQKARRLIRKDRVFHNYAGNMVFNQRQYLRSIRYKKKMIKRRRDVDRQ